MSAKTNPEYERFERMAETLMKVTHQELKEKLEAEKRKKKRQKSKKSAASGRAASGRA